MPDQIDSRPGQARRRSKGLLIATSVFGLLYLAFVIGTFIPALDGSMSSSVPSELWDRAKIAVRLEFLVFLIGYLVVRKNELIGGTIFILWWVVMWFLEILVFAPIVGGDAGGAVGFGLPVFIFGVLFVRRWYKERSIETDPGTP